jgi:hypothetical protein
VSFTGEDPSEEEHYGGRVLVRMPISLHRDLVEAARAERVSLNQFVCALLASGVNWRHDSSGRAAATSGEHQHNSRLSDEEFSAIWRDAIG